MSEEQLTDFLRVLRAKVDELDTDKLREFQQNHAGLDSPEDIDAALNLIKGRLGIDLRNPHVRSRLRRQLQELGLDTRGMRRGLH